MDVLAPAEPRPRILVIDDEPGSLKVIAANLRQEGYTVGISLDGAEGLKKLEEEGYDLVVLDYLMPKMDGMQFLQAARNRRLAVPIIMITAYATVKMAVEAMKLGAYNYLTKPLNYDELKLLVRQALEKRLAEQRLARLRQELTERYGFHALVGKNHLMRRIYQTIEAIAATDVTVLIQGETGTGKELIAKAIHYNSRRRDAGFFPVNCAALAESLLESELFGHEKGAFTGATRRRIGRFESAGGGTFFLDEVSEIPLAVQVKLLRVLEERVIERVGGNERIPVDIRIIAATTRDLKAMVDQGRIREDLYYRLNVMPLVVPPLRERKDDIPLLAEHFLDVYREKWKRDVRSISPSLMGRLFAHEWPGNVRELEHWIERAVVLAQGEALEADDLDAATADLTPALHDPAPGSFLETKRQIIESFEREYFRRLLAEARGSIGEAARLSGLNERNVYEKMRRYGLRKEEFR
jgi:two-component system response regulator AtoC